MARSARDLTGPPSAQHALLWGLRDPGSEVELTRAIGAVAAADPRFAAAFAELLINTAASRGGDFEHAANRLRIPAKMTCEAEIPLEQRGRKRSARRDVIDLKFTGEGVTLLVELKLEAGFGREQMNRYLRWKPSRGKGGVVAITKHEPLYGEPHESTRNWLGSVRWGEIYDAMKALPISDRELKRQWRLFLEVLDHSGDIGVSALDWNLLKRKTKKEVSQRGDQRRYILEGLWSGWVADLEAAVRDQYGEKKARAVSALPRPSRGTRGEVIRTRKKRPADKWIRLATASGDRWCISVELGDKGLIVDYCQRRRPPRRQRDEAAAALVRLNRDGGFKGTGTHRQKIRRPASFLQGDPDELLKRVRRLVQQDIDEIVSSGVLKWEI